MKIVQLAEIGEVKLVKSARNRSIRLTITSSDVRVSLPHWTPYAVGIAFAKQHSAWIQVELAKQSEQLLRPDQKVGKLHHLHFVPTAPGEKPTSRVTATKIIVKLAPAETYNSAEAQTRATKAVHRALKKETEQLLPPRLERLAAEHGFNYHTVSAKQLKRRWGSCDRNRDIVLNFFLMELPWDLIDYVLLHELTHTEHLHHGPDFWQRLKQVSPRALDLRRQINTCRPIIQSD